MTESYVVASDAKFIGQAEVAVHVRVDEPGDLDDASVAQAQAVDRAEWESLGARARHTGIVPLR